MPLTGHVVAQAHFVANLKYNVTTKMRFYYQLDEAETQSTFWLHKAVATAKRHELGGQ